MRIFQSERQIIVSIRLNAFGELFSAGGALAVVLLIIAAVRCHDNGGQKDRPPNRRSDGEEVRDPRRIAYDVMPTRKTRSRVFMTDIFPPQKNVAQS